MRTNLILAVSFIATLLVAEFALIQNPKWAVKFLPKDIQEAVKDRPDIPVWAKVLIVLGILTGAAGMIGVFAYAIVQGRRAGFGFWAFFVRFLTMLYVEKAFDMFVLDYLWIKKSGWGQKRLPETANCKGWQEFRVFRREQVVRLVAFPFVCALMAWLSAVR